MDKTPTDYPDRDYLTEENGFLEPMTCNDCGRPAYYDYDGESYRHALEAERGCFLIPADPDRPDDPNHPLMDLEGKTWVRTRGILTPVDQVPGRDETTAPYFRDVT